MRYGKTVQPIIRGFRKAEKDIRKIAAVVLKPHQLGYLIPQVANALGAAEKKGEELIDFTMHQMILLIVIGLIGYIIAKLLIEFFLAKMRAPSK